MYHKTDHRLNRQIRDLHSTKIPVSLRTILLWTIVYFIGLPIVLYVTELTNNQTIMYIFLLPVFPVIGITYFIFTGKLPIVIKVLHRLLVRSKK